MPRYGSRQIDRPLRRARLKRFAQRNWMRHRFVQLVFIELAVRETDDPQATPLPIRLVSARHSLMNLSMPTRMAIDWILKNILAA